MSGQSVSKYQNIDEEKYFRNDVNLTFPDLSKIEFLNCCHETSDIDWDSTRYLNVVQHFCKEIIIIICGLLYMMRMDIGHAL